MSLLVLVNNHFLPTMFPNTFPCPLEQFNPQSTCHKRCIVSQRLRRNGMLIIASLFLFASWCFLTSINVDTSILHHVWDFNGKENGKGSIGPFTITTSNTTQQHNRALMKVHEGAGSARHICQAIMDQHVAPEKALLVHVIENNEICTDPMRTTTALSRIFISSTLVYQAASVGFLVTYRHGCERYRGSGMIQEFLPPQIDIRPELVPPISRDALISLCQTLDVALNVDLLQMIIPIIRENIKMVVDSILSQIDSNGNLPRHGILNYAKKDYNGEPDTAVIFLPCRDRQCSDLWVIPFYSFLENIPGSVRAVTIIMTPSCKNALTMCRQYVMDLADTLEDFDSTRKVDVMIAYPSSIEVMMRFMVANYVLCGAGWGKQWLIPALARSSQVQGQFVVWERKQNTNGKEPFVESMAIQTILSKIGAPDVLDRISIPDDLLLESLVELNMKPGQVQHFLQSPPLPDSGICRFLRGKFGTWVQDFDYARQVAYSVPLLHHSGAAETIFQQRLANNVTGGLSFRPSATYRWQETSYRDHCTIQMVTKEKLCSVLSTMDIRRIFFLGDSLTLEQCLSLWMLLGPTEDIPLADQSSFSCNVSCPNHEGFSFLLQFIRNDELMENSKPVSMRDQVMNCKNYCYPWAGSYKMDESRTLMVVNIGAHLHDRALFESAIQRFIESFDSLDRVNDIILLRTLVPGHKNCGRKGLKPYHSLSEYIEDSTNEKVKDTYNWGVFTSYNNFMGRVLSDRARGKRAKARMELLDVFPMTILRPDGHMADEYKASETKRTDCLHYSQPGPIDWWNHLMFANLLDIQATDKAIQ